MTLLKTHDAEWAVLGAVAANLYRAETRTTTDLDVLVSVGVGGMERIAQTARAAGWEVRAVGPENWLLRIRRRGVGAVDLMLVEEDYQRTAFERSRPEALAGGVRARVLAVEDIIIHKLIANRARDDADIVSILDAGHDLDWKYLDHWMREWDVAHRLEALQQRLERERGDDSGCGWGS